MGLRRMLFGSRFRIAVVAVVSLVVLLAAAFAAGLLGTPSVAGVDNVFGDVTNETTVVEKDLVVRNPNPIGVQLGESAVNYTVRMNGIPMASGNESGIGLRPGNTTLRFETALRNRRIPRWWVSHVARGERTRLALDAQVQSGLGVSATVPYAQSIETDVIGAFNSTERRPVNANQPLVSDPVLYVERTNASWGDVSRSKTPIDLRFVVSNPKPAAYVISEVGYDITMNGIAVGSGASDRAYTIPPGGQETIRTRTAIRNARLDEWWVSHLRRNQTTDLRIDFYARIELPGGETVRVPLRGVDYETRVETDIFGERGDPPGGRSTPTPTATATPTPTDGGPIDATPRPDTPTDDGPLSTRTPTPTPATTQTPTATANDTATPTATDDDGLLE
jgi:LEA14-like dessication related protein